MDSDPDPGAARPDVSDLGLAPAPEHPRVSTYLQLAGLFGMLSLLSIGGAVATVVRARSARWRVW